MQQGIADLQSGVHTNELTVGWWKSRSVCVTVWCQFVIITMNSCLCPISARYSFIFYRHEFKGESRGQKDKSWQELQLFDTRLYYNKWLELCCSSWLILNTLPTPSFSCQCQYKKLIIPPYPQENLTGCSQRGWGCSNVLSVFLSIKSWNKVIKQILAEMYYFVGYMRGSYRLNPILISMTFTYKRVSQSCTEKARLSFSGGPHAPPVNMVDSMENVSSFWIQEVMEVTKNFKDL